MSEQQIAASPTELQTLTEVISEANAAKIEADKAHKAATRNWILFCEGKGIPGATFVGISTEGTVIVSVPEKATEDAPKLVA